MVLPDFDLSSSKPHQLWASNARFFQMHAPLSLWLILSKIRSLSDIETPEYNNSDEIFTGQVPFMLCFGDS